MKKEEIQPPPIYLSVETNPSEGIRSKNSMSKVSVSKFDTVSKSPEIDKILRTLAPPTISPSENH